MSVVLARVDDRLVHGQVVEGWVPHVSAEVIVVVSDRICLDSGRCRLLMLIVPDNLDLKVVPPGELGIFLRDMAASKILLLFEDLNDVLATFEEGVALDRVNIGNLHHVRGGVEVTPSVYLNRKDIEMIRYLAGKGVSVEALEVPDGKPFNLTRLIERTEGLI